MLAPPLYSRVCMYIYKYKMCIFCVCVCVCLVSRQSMEHVAVCVPLSPVPRRARAGSFARACVTPSIRTGIRGAFFHFFIEVERACDGGCDVVSSRLQARATRPRRARAGESERDCTRALPSLLLTERSARELS